MSLPASADASWYKQKIGMAELEFQMASTFCPERLDLEALLRTGKLGLPKIQQSPLMTCRNPSWSSLRETWIAARSHTMLRKPTTSEPWNSSPTLMKWKTRTNRRSRMLTGKKRKAFIGAFSTWKHTWPRWKPLLHSWRHEGLHITYTTGPREIPSATFSQRSHSP